jgi:hypothetical protein
MLALSIRQPYAELILRGVKTIEYRSRPTRKIGERFYIYASKGLGVRGQGLEKGFGIGGQAPGSGVFGIDALPPESAPENADLPRGVIVGTAVISHVTPSNGGPFYEWHLTVVQRLRGRQVRKPKGRPQPVWFRPF